MTTEPKRYRATIRVEIDVDGVFPSYAVFEQAVEQMWIEGEGYVEDGRKRGISVEENWVELVDVDNMAEDED